MMVWIFEGLMFLSVAGLLAAFHGDLAAGTILLKTLASLFFVLTGVYGYRRDQDGERRRLFSKPVLIALLCSMAGDVLLALDRTQGIFFVLGVAGFAGAHVMFSLAFCRVCAVRKTELLWTFVIFAQLVLLLALGDFDFQGLLPVLIGYAAVISFMTVMALSFWKCRQGQKKVAALIMCGGVLFLFSDIVLLFWLFGIGMPKGVQSVNWILYYVAQGCLAASLSARSARLGAG